MKYNLLIRTRNDIFNVLGINDSQLDKIVDAYLSGDKDVTLAGKKYFINKTKEIYIYTHDKKIEPEEFKSQLIQSGNIRRDLLGDNYLKEEHLKLLGRNITEHVIGDAAFGDSKKVSIVEETNIELYVDLDRIEELKTLTSDYDLKKLIRLCEELNDNYSRQNFYSVGMLVRTIIDHIPPIFGLSSFKEVANNYGSGGKSFSKNMKHLENSFRNIGDGYLHTQIRGKEILPNEIQVNFKQDLDVLLGEIIRIL